MYELAARYYEIIHAELTADVELVLELAGQTGGRVLELGCGAGRLLLPLARAGFEVTGVDNSPAMLARARRHLAGEPPAVQKRTTLLEEDMVAFAGDGPFALVILPYNTLMHLPAERSSVLFKRIGRYLKADSGRLFIDLMNPLAIAHSDPDQALTLERRFIDPETGEMVAQMSSSRLDEAAQTLHVTWFYDASPPAGGPARRIMVQDAYHYLYPHQLDLALQRSGFRLEAIYGDYDRTPFSEESGRLLLLAAL